MLASLKILVLSSTLLLIGECGGVKPRNRTTLKKCFLFFNFYRLCLI